MLVMTSFGFLPRIVPNADDELIADLISALVVAYEPLNTLVQSGQCEVGNHDLHPDVKESVLKAHKIVGELLAEVMEDMDE